MDGAELDAFAALLRKLNRVCALSEADEATIRGLPWSIESKVARSILIREGEHAALCSVLLDGYVAKGKTALNGSRQIVSFHMPGDLLDIEHVFFRPSDHNLHTVTNVVVARVAREDLRSVTLSRPGLAEAFWCSSLLDAAIYRQWLLNVARRNAKSRVAHMLCEFTVRASMAGLGSPAAFEFPMTQVEIAHATGLTPVHLNRIIGDLAEQGLIVRRKGRLSIGDWIAIQRTAGFKPAYLETNARVLLV
ncbi:Crp/Fnr family transcriptional regulator [Sphingomonas sp. BIUV-7]|uniref:Crp/Fnr family transcriptional regulator n=1 Tax=Sphingomonas natans TaxID=3063330 RepID=A0ABT8Y8B3_9SPHN|nr:Crp/Fnr family transcriptional regulator [Sphingomonas sp. BIUV-7]MDO6414118.1 Crp/Fnr family transcriptional regulator [Sphingomonas sp. BIUV-7]